MPWLRFAAGLDVIANQTVLPGMPRCSTPQADARASTIKSPRPVSRSAQASARTVLRHHDRLPRRISPAVRMIDRSNRVSVCRTQLDARSETISATVSRVSAGAPRNASTANRLAIMTDSGACSKVRACRIGPPVNRIVTITGQATRPPELNPGPHFPCPPSGNAAVQGFALPRLTNGERVRVPATPASVAGERAPPNAARAIDIDAETLFHHREVPYLLSVADPLRAGSRSKLSTDRARLFPSRG